jgi:ABC-type bacteriocin/lantibiotic exporter with double-glycine peptidase domain
MLKQYLDVFKYSKTFYSYAGRRAFLIFFLSGISAILESIGLIALMPFLGIIILENKNSNKISNFSSIYSSEKIPIDGLNLIQNFFYEHSLFLIAIVIIFLFILKALTYFASLSSIAYLRGNLLILLKSRLAEGYAYMNHSSFIKKDAGSYINVINNQVDRALQGFQGISQIYASLISGLIYFIFSCYIGWRYAVIMLIISLGLGLLFKNLNSHVKLLSLANTEESSKTSRISLQLLNSHKYLVSTGCSKNVLNKVFNAIGTYGKQQIKSGIAGSITYAIKEPLGVFTVIFMLLIHHILFSSPVESAFVSIALLYRGFQTIMSVQLGLQGALNFAGDIENINKEINNLQSNTEKNGLAELKEFSQDITLENITFKYDSRKDIALKNINLNIPFARKIAIIGKSGSGKSTLIDLLTLLQDPASGTIRIDGISTIDIEKSSWRKQIGFVSQDGILFDDSVASNISLWAGDFDSDIEIREKIIKAAKIAFIHDFIESLPNKYLTLVGDRGVNLSGGQRQRLMIARELFKEPRFLILDEATSALDLQTEATLYKNLNTYSLNCTLLIVTHRFSCLKDLDSIYIIEKGIIIESGTYEELSSNCNSKFSLLSKDVFSEL